MKAMQGKLSSSLSLLFIISLLNLMLYLALPRESIGSAILQILIAAVFVGFILLLHKTPAKLVKALKEKLPLGLTRSKWPFTLAVLLVPILSLLLVISVFSFGFKFKESYASRLEVATNSEYLIPRLDSFKQEFVQIGGLEDIRSKYIEYEDEEFRNAVLNRSAFVACVQGDLQQASEFVDSGLKWYPGDKELLAIRGLIAYEQSSYQESLEIFRQVIKEETQPGTGKGFQATMLGNEGLVQWELGQTKQSEVTLVTALELFNKAQATREESFLLLNQGKLYADYWQLANASVKNDRALELINRIETSPEARVQRANVSRQTAEIALIRGSLNLASREVESAIETHLSTGDVQYLAQDYEVKADIREQAGLYDEALELLKKAEDIYKKSKVAKELSENWLKQSKLLLAQDKYPNAERLIKDASIAFVRLGYRRGIGQASMLEGELLRQRAVSKDIAKDNPQLVITESRKASERYQAAYNIFQEIGYVRGVADASNFLGMATVQTNKPVNYGANPVALSDGAFLEARQHFERAAELYRQIGDKRGAANVYTNLGILYRNHRDYQPALNWLNKALQIHEEIGFELGMVRILLNIGRVYCEKSDVEEARRYLIRAKDKLALIQGGQKELKAVELYLNELCK